MAESVAAASTTTDLRQRWSTFFRLVFGRLPGQICIATAAPSANSTAANGMAGFAEAWFSWPDQEEAVLTHVLAHAESRNVWFCPQLFQRPVRRKEHVAHAPSVWADLDTCDPSLLLVEPTVVVQSSPGRWQALWALTPSTPTDHNNGDGDGRNAAVAPEIAPADAEAVARAIAYHHRQHGADRSGWDLTQLLRVPYTHNLKYPAAPVVQVAAANRNTYRLADFSAYPDSSGYQQTALLPFPADNELGADPGELLRSRRLRISPLVWDLMEHQPPTGTSWSEPLWQLELLLFEAGFTPPQVLVIARHAACNKYARDGRAQQALWGEICRAHARYQQRIDNIDGTSGLSGTSNTAGSGSGGAQSRTARPLLSEDERERVQGEETFVERYIAWATGLSDAAPQYHQAGAFVCLSALLSGAVRLPTSFGTLVPNLWFLVLGSSTLTRKTTTMDLAMDLLTEIDPDVLLATDGSIEGMLTQLALRPARPGVFLRDEFSGLLEQIAKRDYYAGMPEVLTKLYDGKIQRRILRREIIEVRDPVLLLYAGGIKNRVTALLSAEHVTSGFLPRFVPIIAEVDLTRLKPLGPPSACAVDDRATIRSELADLAAHYGSGTPAEPPAAVYVTGSAGDPTGLIAPLHQRRVVDAELTEDAWVRYAQLEMTLVQAGEASERPELMTPTYDRLAKSILKAAVLLAASRQRPRHVEHGQVVTVEETDLLRAAFYGQGWRAYADDLVANVGLDESETTLQKIYRHIRDHGQTGVSRSALMRRFRLNAKQADLLLTTMEQRLLVHRARAGRAEVLYPTT